MGSGGIEVRRMDGGWLAVTAPVPAGAEVVVVAVVVVVEAVELVVAVPEVLVAAVVEGIGSW